MGYSTDFTGELKFVNEATASQLAKLNTILNKDCRDHPEWGADDLYYVDLELLDDYSGLRWNGAEKTHGMVEVVNMIIRLMREGWPEFGLTGKLNAQGEEFDDRWILKINEEGVAVKKDVLISGQKIVCPRCEHTFILED